MSEYKVTYFDIDGGRGEPIRIALHAAGINFEDVRWSFPEFGEHRHTQRFNAVPTLTIDGEQYTQSNAISRYVAKQCNLYPADPLQALYCDEVLEALEDMNHYVVQTFGLKGEELKQARQTLVDGRLTVFLKGLNELLTRGGGEYFAGGQLSIADLKALTQIRVIRAGGLDHVPADLVDNLAPGLAAHQARIEAEPVVVAYYAARKA